MGQKACPIGPVQETFAAAMLRTRTAQGLSQRELAERITSGGWPVLASALYKIESGERRLTVDDAVAIANGLGMKLPPELGDLFRPCTNCGGAPPAGFACKGCGAGL